MPPAFADYLPVLTSLVSAATAAKVVGAIVLLIVAVALGYYASPRRLSQVLSEAMEDVEDVYTDMISTDLFTLLSSKELEGVRSTMRMLRLKVSALQAETLRNSLSWRISIGEFFKGRSFTLYRCIDEVRDFETHINILKQEHRGRLNMHFSATVP
ncbi:hypothetical protein B0H16DRAFT_1593473 [Mycena metata]|uniref:Uncharacterized protein n=1 Tax=Mycena metata TaxID=1033252 RepID=A0AAD7MQ05_9AGAR|nr:hypothetical protein B0H16DRAFT_1593473 [Mycena metata]